MAGFGVPHEQIAVFMRIDAKTLRKHYRDELDRGMVEANVKVAQTLFQLATVDRNVPAAIFWLKARAGWREKIDTTHQLLDAEGEAVDPVDNRRPISELLAEALISARQRVADESRR